MSRECDTPPAVTTQERLVQATREEIRQLAHEIAALSQQELTPNQYFAAFLPRVVQALAALAGAVWIQEGDQSPAKIAQVNWGHVVSPAGQAAHLQTIQATIADRRLLSLPPRAEAAGGDSRNPTDHLWIVVPVPVDQQMTVVIEVFQRPHRGPATERGYARFLADMAELAGKFLGVHRLGRMSQQQRWSDELEQFSLAIHRSLDVNETSFAVVNEARRVSGFDRVSLALGPSRRGRIEAISGLDRIDRRARQVRQLARLAACVMRMREPLCLGEQTDDLSPQVEVAWNEYVDTSHARRCLVIPLFSLRSEETQGVTPAPLGGLIFEQLIEGMGDPQRDQHAHALARHGAVALANALEHERLFLLPVWRALGNGLEALGGRHFSKTLAVVVLLVATAVALTTVSSELTVAARGQAQSTTRQTVFARENGVITNVPVEHGKYVEAGQLLLEMRNTDLEVEITSLVGKLTTTQEQMLTLQRTLLDNPRLANAEQSRLSGELLQLRQAADSTERQLALVRDKEQQLQVRADHAGQIVTWHIREKLLHRPVQKGQALLAIVDPASEWELELSVPERHVSYILDAMARTKDPLQVTFVLSSHAGQTFAGQLVDIDRVAIAHDAEDNSVRIRVAIDRRQLPELRSDATVVARIYCGEQSLGYVWFHDLIDTVRTKVMFWL
ncbi:MAG: efflux RND transporter periplasmic adaptor subunit [Pirellulaceae bacterium]